MKIGIWFSRKVWDTRLADAFAAGCMARGETIVRYDLESPKVPDVDVAFIFGVKSRERFQAMREAGINTVYFDKGYDRTTVPGPERKECLFWRVAVNSHHPTPYLPRMRSPDDRWKALGIQVRPWQRRPGGPIIVAGSSLKYHEFSGLPHPTEYAADVVRKIRKRVGTKVIYRPKPSWKEAEPVNGAEFSVIPEKLSDLLAEASVLVTNGSNSCFEAVLAGVPCIVLGEAVARPISSTSIDSVAKPYLATEEERMQWLADLAYCQWTMDELRSGEAWGHIRRMIDGL